MRNRRPRVHKAYFEVTNACNFRCDFCPMHVSARKTRHMDLALFQKGVDDIVRDEVTDTVGFHILGEPLLYPRIYEALAYAKSKGLRTELNTNGSLLTADRVDGLAEAGLDQLAISVQVTDAQEHECRGTELGFGEYYGRVMEAIRRIKRGRGRTDVVLCSMNTSTQEYFDIDVPMRVNGRRGAFRASLARFILDVYAALDKRLSQEIVEAALGRLNLTFPQFIRIEPGVLVYAQPFGDWGNAFTSRKVHPARMGFCGYALTNVGVLNSGEVTICCVDYDGRTSLGDLQTDSLASLLSSEKAQAIREGYEKMRVVHPYCQRCMGSTSRVKAFLKGLGSIYLFRLLNFQPARVKEVPLMTA